MAQRVMFVQLKSGYDGDRGPAWISWVRFNRTWRTAYWHGRTLHRVVRPGEGNFRDAQTGEAYWLSGPHRDRADVRWGPVRPAVDDDARAAYEAFLRGAALPGRERG